MLSEPNISYKPFWGICRPLNSWRANSPNPIQIYCAKKIEEFSIKNNSPILSIPGISHFSGTSILAELGDIGNYSKPSQIIKFAGVAPYHYESSQYNAQHTGITKKGSKYLRKTLYQIILPVINNNPVFKKYYRLKISQGKGHRCAQGHCIRKLLRIIYHLLETGQSFDPALLR